MCECKYYKAKTKWQYFKPVTSVMNAFSQISKEEYLNNKDLSITLMDMCDECCKLNQQKVAKEQSNKVMFEKVQEQTSKLDLSLFGKFKK